MLCRVRILRVEFGRDERPKREGEGMGSHNHWKCFDAGRYPYKVAIIDPAHWHRPREITYRAFDDLCDAVARGLIRRGLKPGDRVGILALNRTEFLAAFFGTMRAG